MDNSIIENIVRVGVVSAVDAEKRRARVYFDALGITSGWLFVLQRHGSVVTAANDGGHSHTVSGGGTASAVPAHAHAGSVVTTWMPGVNDIVLVLYIPIHNGDGFILGGI
jgi:hypothetical protein